MRTFEINRDPFGEGILLYRKKQITLQPGLTVLVGCNGAGKSTLLKTLERKLEDEHIPVLHYDSNKAVSGGISKAEYHNDFEMVANMMTGSEGEKIKLSAGTLARNLGYFALNEHKDAKELWILIDSIDSGFSIDNIIDLKEQLFGTILETTEGKDVYIVVSANTYAMTEGEKCFDVYEGKYREFKSYKTYKNFVLRSRKRRDTL